MDASPAARIEPYDGPRADVRWLFELAEDSVEQLDSYLDDGEVLLAIVDGRRVGLLQLTPHETDLEIKLLAIAPDLQRRGLGRLLIDAAVERARQQGCARLLVSTAAADTGNLRFYQRCGFRMLCIEREAFTPATGYPDPIVIDGIRLWDRVWFDLDLTA